MKRVKKTTLFIAGIFVFALCAYFLRSSNAQVYAAVPYVNNRVNLNDSNDQANDYTESSTKTSMSEDGRYIVFSSLASNLVANDTNGHIADIFIRDTQANTTRLVDVNANGDQPNVGVQNSKISSNGRYVAFLAYDSSLVSGDNNGRWDLFVKDLQSGSIDLISKSTSGAIANGDTRPEFDISADGRYVVFSSAATNLVSGDTNGEPDIFVRDTDQNTTTLVSTSSAGSEGNDMSLSPTISCDGARISFNSYATNLVSTDTNGKSDVFVVDRISGSVSDITANGNDESDNADISCDGATVLINSAASDLITNDTNSRFDLFAYDIDSGLFDLVDVASDGTQADYGAGIGYLSANGNFVVFESYSTDIAGTEGGGPDGDVFLRNRKKNITERLSKRDATTDMGSSANVSSESISDDGTKVAFVTNDPLIPNDTNGFEDVYVAGTGSTACSF